MNTLRASRQPRRCTQPLRPFARLPQCGQLRLRATASGRFHEDPAVREDLCPLPALGRVLVAVASPWLLRVA